MGKTKISAGTHRGHIICFPDLVSLRPTPQRLRMALFNWMGQDLRGCHCLDLFAGSGALSFEAISRGATADMVEIDALVCQALQKNKMRFHWENHMTVVCMEAEKFWEKATADRYDLIFLDPPFQKRQRSLLLNRILSKVSCGTYIVWEYAMKEEPQPLPSCCELLKRTSCGQSGLLLLQKIQ